MLDSTSPVVVAYRQNRSKGVPAKPALTWARSTVKRPALEWELGDGHRTFKTARFQRDGFDVVAEARTYPEDWQDAIGGNFTDRATSTTVRNPQAWDHDGNLRHRRDRFAYYEPACSYRDHYHALRRSHSRAEADRLARSYVQAELQRALDCGQEWQPVTLFVRVYRAGVELGSANVGGFASDDDEVGWDDAVEDMLAEAMHEAQEKLASLTARVCTVDPGDGKVIGVSGPLNVAVQLAPQQPLGQPPVEVSFSNNGTIRFQVNLSLDAAKLLGRQLLALDGEGEG